jgi:hypothetical protein
MAPISRGFPVAERLVALLGSTRGVCGRAQKEPAPSETEYRSRRQYLATAWSPRASWPMFLVLGMGTGIGAVLARLAVLHAPRLVHRPGKIKEMRARSSQGRLTSKRRLRR